MADAIRSVRDLKAYQTAFDSAMAIFNKTKSFPAEERYSLTDQIRRSSRSVCTNLAEGWRKRKYQKAFVAKVLDAMQEASETQTWLEFSLACGYIGQKEFQDLYEKYDEVGKMLNGMEKKSASFCF
jgi:four helix bundle protein